LGRTFLIAALALGLSRIATGQAAAAPQQFPVPLATVAEAVVATLASKGINVSADQVKLPLNVVATEENPPLEAGAVEKLGHLSGSQPGQLSASVKLRCKTAGACRPFFAIATWEPSQQAAQPMAAGKDGAATQVAVARPASPQPSTRTEQQATAIKAGQPLILLLDGDHMRIQMTVVSLTAGSVGQTIRVSSPDHKHTYMAEVLNESTVKGTL
jgi:hypothetical protein